MATSALASGSAQKEAEGFVDQEAPGRHLPAGRAGLPPGRVEFTGANRVGVETHFQITFPMASISKLPNITGCREQLLGSAVGASCWSPLLRGLSVPFFKMLDHLQKA